MTGTLEAISEVIKDTTSLVLVTHINPDGDALGSLLGFSDILEDMGKQVFCFAEKSVSRMYDFLPGTEKVQTEIDDLKEFVAVANGDIAAIALDCGDRARLGDQADELMQVTPFLVIDHHQSNDGFGDIAWVEPHRSSTGEMIFDLAQELGITLSTTAAYCLYTAILTDTGSFRYETTSAHTFAVAGKLIAAGVRPEEVADKVFDNYTPGRMRLLDQVLATLELHYQDRIAFIDVNRVMYEKTGTRQDDTDNFINFPRSISSVEVVVFLKEVEEGRISISLRSKGRCDVAAIAAQFGGGGHRNAAGFRKKGSLEKLRSILLPILKKSLARDA